jgi:cytochrome c biogenesis protein ResB
MEGLFILGSLLLLIAIAATVGSVLIAQQGLNSAKEPDYLQEFYKEEFGDEP